MKQLPQARATGNIHIGTMAGKLNGVIPATTPKGCRRLWLSTRVPTFSVTSPLSSCGAAVANSTTSMPRVDLAQRVGIDLAVLGGDRLGDPGRVLLQQPQELLQDPGPAQGRGHATRPGKAARATATASSTSAALASATSPVCSPVAGL